MIFIIHFQIALLIFNFIVLLKHLKNTTAQTDLKYVDIYCSYSCRDSWHDYYLLPANITQVSTNIINFSQLEYWIVQVSDKKRDKQTDGLFLEHFLSQI